MYLKVCCRELCIVLVFQLFLFRYKRCGNFCQFYVCYAFDDVCCAPFIIITIRYLFLEILMNGRLTFFSIALSIRINLHIKNFSIHASTAHSAASLSVCLSGNSRGAILSLTFSWIYSLLNQFETLSFGSGTTLISPFN